MHQAHSVQRVREHLSRHGGRVPADASLRPELRAMARQCEELQARGEEYGEVELSRYMKSLLRISGCSHEA